MAALRAIVLLLAVSAACAGKVSGSVRATGVQRAVNEATRHIDSQIAEIENYGVVTDLIDEFLEKLKELVEKIKEKVTSAEAALLKAIKKAAETVTERLNKLIEKATGVDLHLEDLLEEFEENTENCTEELRAKVNKTLLAIKTDAETCAASKISEAEKLTQQIRDLIDIIESVPVNTVKGIQQCINPNAITTTTPLPETTTPEPETTTTAEPETTTAAEPETTTAAKPETTTAQADGETTTLEPQEDQSEVESNVVVFDVNNRRRSVRGISDIIEKINCVVEVLGEAALDLARAPRLVYYVDKEIRDLASKETQKTLKKCAVKAVSGRTTDLQRDVAELAYCILAPSDDDPSH